jgi:hypothetical protein
MLAKPNYMKKNYMKRNISAFEPDGTSPCLVTPFHAMTRISNIGRTVRRPGIAAVVS